MVARVVPAVENLAGVALAVGGTRNAGNGGDYLLLMMTMMMAVVAMVVVMGDPDIAHDGIPNHKPRTKNHKPQTTNYNKR